MKVSGSNGRCGGPEDQEKRVTGQRNLVQRRVLKSENLDHRPVPETRTQSVVTSCKIHVGEKKELMERLLRSL